MLCGEPSPSFWVKRLCGAPAHRLESPFGWLLIARPSAYQPAKKGSCHKRRVAASTINVWYATVATRSLLHALRPFGGTKWTGSVVTIQYWAQTEMHSPNTNPATMHGRISRPSLDLKILPLDVIKVAEIGKCWATQGRLGPFISLKSGRWPTWALA